jgi:hypothetical protein
MALSLKLAAVFAVLALTGCSGYPSCSNGQVCAKTANGGECANTCAFDGGTCPTGQTCQQLSGCCSGTGATCILVSVCL